MLTSINYKTGIILDAIGAPPFNQGEALYSGTAPIITNTQSANTTIVGGVKWTPDPVPLGGSDRRLNFTYLGAGDYVNGVGVPDVNFILPLSRYPNTYASGQSNHSYEFMFYGQIFEHKYKYISGATEYRLYINDRPVTSNTQDVPGPPSAGSSNVLKVDLGSVDVWKIRFEMATMPFGGVFTAPGDVVWPTNLIGPRIMGFGDSITDGSAQNQGAGQGTWLKRFGRLTGSPDTWDQSRGSTGYITPGTFTTLPLRAPRDVVPYQPDVVVMWAGYNDQTIDPVALEQIRQAAINTINIIQAGVPNVDIIMGGVWEPSGTPSQSPLLTNAVLKQVAFSKDLAFVEPITGLVYDRYENVVYNNGGPWITTTNAPVFVGADNVHPNNAGHQYLANKWFAAYASLYQRDRT
jgi:lysophospholipase L1-like esterase